MKIEFIHHPFVFTDTGKRHLIEDLTGTPKVGAELSENLEVLTNTSDENCVGGACPIK